MCTRTRRPRRFRSPSTSRCATAASARASICCCSVWAAASRGARCWCAGEPSTSSSGAIDMKLAFVFPGQGSQQVGMMQCYAAHPVVKETFTSASAVLGEDLWTLVESGPAEALNLTRNTQPVMLTAGVAVWRAWRAAGGPEPSVMAGHSLGEYTALVAAGALKFEDAVPLVRFRAEAMQDAVPAGVGAMAAVIGGDDDAVIAACAESAQGD